MTTHPIDPLLARQLRRLELPAEVAQSSAWQQFVDGVNDHYIHMSEERTLLSRSIELSTQEMDGLRRRVESQRDHLVAVMVEISDALRQFAARLHGGGPEQVTEARRALAGRLQAILDDARTSDERGAEVSGIRDNLLQLADQLAEQLAEQVIGLLGAAAGRKALEVARAVHQLLIPPHPVIDLPPLSFAGHFQSAEECGGDWWTVAALPQGRALVVVGDVTGHGVASALITVAAKATCELALHLAADRVTPGALLGMMNQTLYRMARRSLMMTCVAAVVDPAARVLTVANAGHPFPILLRNRITHPILAEGPQLGDSPTAVFEDSQIEILSGDLMVCFTDGASECENAKGERFTERRLRALVQRVATGNAAATCRALVAAIDGFRGDHPPGDDLTMVVMAVD
jgi:sigma-B regulation protein RsbU (phosphoserine phosphatase)